MYCFLPHVRAYRTLSLSIKTLTGHPACRQTYESFTLPVSSKTLTSQPHNLLTARTSSLAAFDDYDYCLEAKLNSVFTFLLPDACA